MRFDGNRCGKCFAEKPLLKTPTVFKFTGFVAAIGLCCAITLQVAMTMP
jgi:hypothetical protein